MACLEMYNSEHKGHHHHHHCAPVSPRISFSNDFVDAQQATKPEQSSSTRSEAPAVSSDFEFSVTNYSMMSADELFFKGRLLPFKDTKRATTTLREELLADDDGDEGYQDFSLRPPKGSSSSTRWKGFLGLRKSNLGIGSKSKVDKCEGSSDTGVETRRPRLFNEGARLNVNSQALLNEEGGSGCRDVEIGL
ncbi:hypothetical protein E2542_SST20135 [Spatholobus suberectus]|nr:hypothetical protein E2542_SST20135 [Spatholobus suberectus]